MGYRLKAAAVVLSIAFLAGCPDAMGPIYELPVDFEFGIQRLQTEPAFVVNPGTGELTIRGYFETACSETSAVSFAQQTDDQLTLVVVGRQPDGCPQETGTVGYQATIRAVPAGTYNVNVTHIRPVSNAPTHHSVGSHVVIH